MIVKGKKVKGLAVFSLQQSKKIATIHDLVSDSSGHKVSALTVGKHGLFTEMQVIPFGDIKSIGEDALVIETDASIKNVSNADKGVQQMIRDGVYIIGTAVITEDGVA